MSPNEKSPKAEPLFAVGDRNPPRWGKVHRTFHRRFSCHIHLDVVPVGLPIAFSKRSDLLGDTARSISVGCCNPGACIPACGDTFRILLLLLEVPLFTTAFHFWPALLYLDLAEDNSANWHCARSCKSIRGTRLRRAVLHDFDWIIVCQFEAMGNGFRIPLPSLGSPCRFGHAFGLLDSCGKCNGLDAKRFLVASRSLVSPDGFKSR